MRWLGAVARICPPIVGCLVGITGIVSSQVSAVSSAPNASTLLISVRSKEEPAELTPADFQIKEDGQPVQIKQVRRVGRLPMRYCVLFDISGSERGQFRSQQETAIRVVKLVVLPKTDLGWLSLFAAESKDGEATDNPEDIVSVISLARSYGPTSLYEAVARCSTRMERSAADSRVRVMFLFSDGGDNQSHITSGEAIERAANAGVRIYSVAPEVPNDSHSGKGIKVMKRFGEATGGQFFSASRGKDADRVATTINQDLSNLYSVSYVAASSENRPRKLDVKCTKHGVSVVSHSFVSSGN
jgi:VWFA-related protein